MCEEYMGNDFQSRSQQKLAYALRGMNTDTIATVAQLFVVNTYTIYVQTQIIKYGGRWNLVIPELKRSTNERKKRNKPKKTSAGWFYPWPRQRNINTRSPTGWEAKESPQFSSRSVSPSSCFKHRAPDLTSKRISKSKCIYIKYIQLYMYYIVCLAAVVTGLLN